MKQLTIEKIIYQPPDYNRSFNKLHFKINHPCLPTIKDRCGVKILY